MKTAVVLCLLITIYGLLITVSKADNGKKNQQEFDVMKAYSDMGLNKAKLIVTNFAELIKLQASMTYIYLNIRKIFNARVITELNKTRAAADAAIAKGKDAGHCYCQTLSNILLCLHNYFEEGTKKVTKIGFIDQCVKDAE
ncbi:hypothetical protein KM043_018579 [Ampulex compressa]|nr:hypothetical protein KM043_018579 [Ampulex compressa]